MANSTPYSDSEVYKKVRKEPKSVEYNGKILSISAIASENGLARKSLNTYYAETGDIYEAIKLAKEGQEKRKNRTDVINVEYNGKELSLGQIAKLENLTALSLKNYYLQTGDIYEAIKLAKEGQEAKKNGIIILDYYGEMLPLTQIAIKEGLTPRSLKKYFEEADDIYEAVKLTREAQENRKEQFVYVEYNGENLSITAIAQNENITPHTLREYYEKTGNIYEAVELVKGIKEKYVFVQYGDQQMSLPEIAKKEEIDLTKLRKTYKSTNDIYEAVKLAKDSREAKQKRKVEYNGEIISLSKIAQIEGISLGSLKKYYEQTNNIYDAVKSAKEAQIQTKEQIRIFDYNGEKITINKISQIEKLSPDAIKRFHAQTNDIYEAIRLARESQEKKNQQMMQVEYNGVTLPLSKVAEIEGLITPRLKIYYEQTSDIYKAIELAKEAQKKNKDRVVLVEYEGEKLSLYIIAKRVGINRDTLQKYYDQEKDIYKAIEQARKSIEDRKQRVTYIEFNGETLPIETIAKRTGIGPQTLRGHFEKTGDIYQAIKNAQESKDYLDDRKTYVEYNGETLALSTIAKRENIRRETLKRNYNETGNIYDAVKLAKKGQEDRKEKLIVVEYNGENLSINAIAQKEGIIHSTLREYYKKTNDIYKSIMLCKTLKANRERKKEIGNTKKFGNLSYYDFSLITGIKYSEVIKALDEGKTLDDLIESKDKNTINFKTRETIKLENGQSLAEYCIENKLNYACIYRAMKVYDKTLEEAVSNYNQNGQATPATWIYEKYGLLLKHLLLKESVDIKRVVAYMREDYLPMEQAIEQYIIRANARKAGLDKDWMEELYDVLSDDSISKEDYNGYLQTFYVDEQEENCIKKSKEQFNNVKRKLLLFELSEVLEEGLFSPEEEKRLFEEYNITEDEVDVIFKDLYKRFTDPGVLMGKDQEEVITPETEQKRDEKISQYKQMVREINQDNNIVFMMRFMVGPNVGTNEEYRNEIHKELAKEEMKKQDISSNN